MTVVADTPAAVVAGRYRILERLGTGGMCIVDKAYDQQAGGFVAIKRVRPDIEQRAEHERRLVREAILLKLVDHPNAINCLDYGGCPEPFLTMPLLAGQPLDASAGCHNGRRVLQVGLPLLSALQAIYETGFVHGDVKPANIMVARDGRIVLIDCNIASSIGSEQDPTMLAPTGCIFGTPSYFAPEQVRGEQVDQRADIFSASVVLYQLLTGRLPFPVGEDRFQTAYAVVREPVRPIEHLAHADLPVAATVLRGLQKRPCDRFRTAGEMIEALATISLPDPGFD